MCDPDVIRTRSLLIWSQTRYRCATESCNACKFVLYPSQWFMHFIPNSTTAEAEPLSHTTQQSKINSVNDIQGSLAAPHDKYRLLNGYPSYTEIFSKRRKICAVCVKDLSCSGASHTDSRMSKQQNSSSILPINNLKVIEYHCHIW